MPDLGACLGPKPWVWGLGLRGLGFRVQRLGRSELTCFALCVFGAPQSNVLSPKDVPQMLRPPLG